MRDYDPATGRYLQADPLGLIDGASVYGYAGQSPMMNMDPTGQCFGPAIALLPACVGAAFVVWGWLESDECNPYTWEQAGWDFFNGAMWGWGGGAAWKAWSGWKAAGAAGRNWTVYQGIGTGVDAGIVRYAWITSRDVAVRGAEHAAESAAKAALVEHPFEAASIPKETGCPDQSMLFSHTSLFVANLRLGQLRHKQKVRLRRSVRLDFGRCQSVAASHARRPPGSAQYRGWYSTRLVNLEQPMTKAPIKTRETTKKARSVAKPATPPSAAAAVSEATATPVVPQPRETKALALRRSLQDPGGASMASLLASTGWQAHTVRAALSGLRKKGWAVQRRTEDGVTIYFIDPEALLPDSEIDIARVGDHAQTAREVAPTPVVSAEDGTAV